MIQAPVSSLAFGDVVTSVEVPSGCSFDRTVSHVRSKGKRSIVNWNDGTKTEYWTSQRLNVTRHKR